MRLVKAFAYGICSLALASTAWAGGGLHDQSASSSSSSSEYSLSSDSSMSSDSPMSGGSSMSGESTARGDFAGAPWGATESDSSATGATSDAELLSSEETRSQEYAAMDEQYWTQQGFSRSEEIPLGG